MAPFSSELGTKFPVSLESSHIISNSQIKSIIISKIDGKSLLFNYQNRDDNNLKEQIGLNLIKILKIVPFGIIFFNFLNLFFNFFKFLKRCINFFSKL
jgi:hypothetical protein